MPDDEHPKPPEDDKFRPEAIAARVDKLGQETDVERVAREEEQKLAERKKESRKGGGLEDAASRRLAKIGEKSVKRPSALAADAIPEAVPLMDRAARAGEWIQKNRVTFGVIVGVAVLAAAGGIGSIVWQDKRNADASLLLAQALADDHGHIATATSDDSEEESAVKQLYPTFKSAAERRDAALAKYRAVESKYAGTGAAILARLGEASLLLDAGDAKGAIAAYDDVKASALARADDEVRGRALEGVGFADELLAQSDAAAKDKHLDDALTEFKALEAVDVDGFKELGMYHQARVELEKGDKAKALELLKAVHTRVTEAGENGGFSYLEFVVEDQIRGLDPTALPPKTSSPMGGHGKGAAGGNVDMNSPEIQKLLRQLQEQQKQKGGAGAPIVPPAPKPGQNEAP